MARYDRYLERLDDLIEEGGDLAHQTEEIMGAEYLADDSRVQSWLVRIDNLLRGVFGEDSPHHSHFSTIASSNTISRPSQAERIVGLLEGAKDDLEGGFLLRQEQLVAGEVFDSVLEKAEHLDDRGFHVPAAVLGRVALENALKQKASEHGIDQSQKASGINQDLRQAEVYGKPEWRQVQAWLDLGNAAAHGDEDSFDPAAVGDMLSGVQGFLAKHLV